MTEFTSREPEPVIAVTVSVDGSRVVLLDGDDLSLVSWNHRPALMQAALRRSGGFAQWKPRRHLLVVPTGDLVDGASNVFSLTPQISGGMPRHPLDEP